MSVHSKTQIAAPASPRLQGLTLVRRLHFGGQRVVLWHGHKLKDVTFVVVVDLAERVPRHVEPLRRLLGREA